MKPIKWIDIDPRSADKPKIALVDFGLGRLRYCIIGTEYGWLHTRSGEIYTWRSYSGARRRLNKGIHYA